jgi:hypothetical protein
MPRLEYVPVWRASDAVKRFPVVVPELPPELVPKMLPELVPEVSLQEYA